MSPDELTLPQAIGQLICPTLFHGTGAYDEAPRLAELARYGWGGYIVFHGDREATRERIERLQQASSVKLLMAADMEHGAGQQIAGLATFPSAMAFGATSDPALAYELGAWTAIEAREVGVNWIFAPVADVTNNPLNPIISIRSFGGDAERVGAMVAAFTRGVQDHGALACAKHFPGHGDTHTDSHTSLGAVGADRERLEAVELPPFKAAIAADVATLMTAHLALPALGVDEPATVSQAIMTGLLREELGFAGLVVTDALVMGGIVKSLDPLEAAVKAIAAGCDVLLMPPDPVATYEALRAAVDAGTLTEARVYEAAGRVLAAKARLERPVAEAPARSAARLAQHAARRAVTLAKGQPGFALPQGSLVIAVDDGVESDRLDGWHEALAVHGLSTGAVVTPATPEATWQSLLEAAGRAPMVLIGVFSPIRVSKDRSVLGASLAARLGAIADRCPTVVASFSSPFVVSQFPQAAAWVLAYGTRPFQVEATIGALLTGGPYPGTSPVTLPDELEAAGDGPALVPTGPSFS